MEHTSQGLMRTAVVGGGAAGFFLAINLKELCPHMDVTIFERSSRVLQKVKISGGGRCNCTNSFADVDDLSAVYPRGHRLMKRLMQQFGHREASSWFERHGVALVTQPDQCVFPAAQDSQAIIDCFLTQCRCLGIEVRTSSSIEALEALSNFDFIALTIGGQPSMNRLQWLADMGHEIVAPVPSLFSLGVVDDELHSLMGTVVDNAKVFIPGTKLKAYGALLITHWGLSGPATLKLSSYAARYLADADYHAPLAINWTGLDEDQVRSKLIDVISSNERKQLTSLHPFDLPTRLWEHIIHKALVDTRSAADNLTMPAGAINKKQLNRLVATLTATPYEVTSRAPFHDEFVTCGGVSLAAVNPATLESRHRPHLFFAGELLDIDGVTGGFNFQAAWTTAYAAAKGIVAAANDEELKMKDDKSSGA